MDLFGPTRVASLGEEKIIFSSERIDNVYIIDLNKIDNKYIKCLMSIYHDTWTWHRRLGHINFELLNDLCKHELVISLPKIKFTKDKSVMLVKRKNNPSPHLSSKI